MAIVKKPIKKVPKAQVGRAIDKLLSKESNRILDRVVKKPAGMTTKAVDYGKVVLTDAQKAKNAEILKNPGSATADSWARAKKVAKKETDAKWKGILNESKGEFNKPMIRPPGSPQTSTLARIARSIKATAKKAAPKSKNGGPIKKAQNGIAKYSDPKPLLDSLSNVKKNLDAKKAILTTKYLDNLRRFNKSKSNLSKKKNGGAIAKDGKWIQKAINPKHKGFCTPETKATCTPKRKALAHTLRKMSKKK